MILRRDNINIRIPAPSATTVDSDVTSSCRRDRRRRRLSSLLLLAVLSVYLSIWLLDYEEQEEPTLAAVSHLSRSLLAMPDESSSSPAARDVLLPSNEQLAALSENSRDDLPATSPPKGAYSLQNVLAAQAMYKSQFGLLMYSPAEDVFTLYYSKNRKWKSGCHKLIKSFIGLSTSLRELFPDRFRGRRPPRPHSPPPRELALALSAGDSPDVYFADPRRAASPRDDYERKRPPSPVLQFGSAFRNSDAMPDEIAMPMPQRDHLGCFVEWSHRPEEDAGDRGAELCRYYSPRTDSNPSGLVYPPADAEWDNLIPQVVWRGTDFTYLGKMRKLRSPEYDSDIREKTTRDAEEESRSHPSPGIRAMKQIYDELVPRWKGVVLTAEAEWEARRAASDPDETSSPRQSLPWANIKFSHFIHRGKKTPTDRGQTYHRFQSSDIPAIGEYIPLETLANYKYHIDLGGGGGTTWSGTLEKLALPGLLFHHLTPTKDYFHDALVAWVHYVPIQEDLSDLKLKYEWAEANPEEAKRIARRGTEWVKRWFGTEEGFGQLFDVFYRERLRGVVDAYRHEEDWREVLEREGGDMRPIMRCSGFYGSECEELDETLDYHVDRSI